jgi:hypothetical protein
MRGMNEEEGQSGNPALGTFGERSAICTSAVTPVSFRRINRLN